MYKGTSIKSLIMRMNVKKIIRLDRQFYIILQHILLGDEKSSPQGGQRALPHSVTQYHTQYKNLKNPTSNKLNTVHLYCIYFIWGCIYALNVLFNPLLEKSNRLSEWLSEGEPLLVLEVMTFHHLIILRLYDGETSALNYALLHHQTDYKCPAMSDCPYTGKTLLEKRKLPLLRHTQRIECCCPLM